MDKIIKKYTNAECLKIIAAYHEKRTAEYIKNGEPFLAVAMFALDAATFAEHGIRLEIHGERQGKRCGKVKAYVLKTPTARGYSTRTVDWDYVRGKIKVFNMDGHR